MLLLGGGVGGGVGYPGPRRAWTVVETGDIRSLASGDALGGVDAGGGAWCCGEREESNRRVRYLYLFWLVAYILHSYER